MLAEPPDDPPDAPTVTPDPDDDYVAALAAADGIVSGDPHLTGLTDIGVTVWSPAAILGRLEGGTD